MPPYSHPFPPIPCSPLSPIPHYSTLFPPIPYPTLSPTPSVFLISYYVILY